MAETTVADAPKISARLVTVTPKIAAKWLTKNTHNRGLSLSRVEQYAADIRRGEWRLNGEAIKIAADGTILDGQHRLEAVCSAEQPIQTLVITGLPSEAQETMDQGRSRTLADVLKLRGEKYWNPLATACRALCTFELYGSIIQPPYEPSPSLQQSTRTLDRNPDLRESVALVYQLRRPWMPSSHLCALHYLFATVDEAAAKDFVEKMSHGDGLRRDHPVYVLRERLVNARLERESITLRMQLALIIKAWNSYMAGEPTTRLDWRAGGAQPEPFPAIDGLAQPGQGETETQGGLDGPPDDVAARAQRLRDVGLQPSITRDGDAWHLAVAAPWHDEEVPVKDDEDLEYLMLELERKRTAAS